MDQTDAQQEFENAQQELRIASEHLKKISDAYRQLPLELEKATRAFYEALSTWNKAKEHLGEKQ